ncbi:hypothetical protein D3C71_2087440 [compost metagenome]
MLPPQAGMPEALMPCLIVQNADAASTSRCDRFGGAGYRPRDNSLGPAPGVRWQPAHIAA